MFLTHEHRMTGSIRHVCEARFRIRFHHLTSGQRGVGLTHGSAAQGIVNNRPGELPPVAGVVSQNSRILLGVRDARAGDFKVPAQRGGPARGT